MYHTGNPLAEDLICCFPAASSPLIGEVRAAAVVLFTAVHVGVTFANLPLHCSLQRGQFDVHDYTRPFCCV